MRTTSFVYKADPVRGTQWAQRFAQQAPELAFRIWPDIGDPHAVRYLAAWQPPDDPLALLPNLEIVFSVGAGIDQFDLSRIPAHIPVVRMIEPGIVEGMVEYVTQAVLTIHRDLFDYAAQQRAEVWRERPVRPAASRRIGVLGLGTLGQAVLDTLRRFGFQCAGWSRTPRTLDGIDCYAGDAALDRFLGRTDILICLLPLTA
ncbi:D-isomer specific 2-hydroxyacid dehydrogenase NAD-binding protein, partial [Burkholderia sp. TJI49]